MSFPVSTKVVCVSEFNGLHTIQRELGEFPNGKPQVGQVYVVAGSYQGYFGNRPVWFLYIVGVPGFWRGQECGWLADRFRRLEDIKAENAAKQHQQEPATA